ncbi:hypothetical protein ACS3SW_11570 [Roseobacteraceae bacterium S113]
MKYFALSALALTCLMTLPAAGEGTVEINPPAEGTVSRDAGLAAFGRIYEVTSHPRCSNCHVGADNIPMWSGPSYGRTRPHGMNINAGESRIGAEYLLCETCHAYNEGANDGPHMAPQVAMSWQLAPVEAEWFGKSSDEICNQLRDPERNGGRDMMELASHLDHDLILHWAWNPGVGANRRLIVCKSTSMMCWHGVSRAFPAQMTDE